MENSTTLQIPSKSKIIVYWEDSPENYSRDEKKRIQSHFSTKYNVDKNNIRVEYRPIKKNESGELIKIDGASIDNILDINHQRELFKEWLNREGREVDFERLVALDNKVNTELGDEFKNESINKNWKIKWITLDNFLSFGEGNTFNVDKLKGLTVINSLPENQGGKSTLVVDSIKYLLFGKTTKTDKNEEIFNQYSDGDEMVIKGLLEIEGEGDIVIERTMKRSKKRSEGWNVKNTLNYYRILPDGTEEVLNEEHAIKTTEKIKEVVGTEKDFELIVLATARNLDDLIDFTSSESGKLLTRFIGLEVIEAKEIIVRKMYNEFAKTMKSNQYNSSTLLEEVEQHKLKVVELTNDKTQVETDITTSSNKLIELNKEKMDLLGTKISIDVEILSMNPSKIESDVETLTNKGIKLSEEVKELTKKIDETGSIKFDEDRHDELTKLVNKTNTDVALKNAEIQRLTKVVEDLIAGGICSACNRKLDDVDNSQHINEHNNAIGVIQKEVTSLTDKLGKYNDELTELNETKKIVDKLSKLELEKSKLEVEISGLRNDIKSKKNDLKLYKQNLDAIEANKKVDIKVSLVDTNIKVEEHNKTELNNKLQRIIIDIDRNNEEITNKTSIIDKITKETDVEKIYKTYIDMVGKKGISKLVLRSVLPIINSELQRLLEEVTDFDVEITIDEKNEVRYLLIKDEVEKQLKSGSGFERTAASLALRCVLGKMTKLSMPNFITLDEVLGRVAPINVERMKLLFDKLKDMYENIYFITQNDVVKDWADNIVTVVKENNISKIKN
jgi:hypothetical protein